MLQAWVGHPYFDVVDNSTGFEGKIARMISVSEKCWGFSYYFVGAGGGRVGVCDLFFLKRGMFWRFDSLLLQSHNDGVKSKSSWCTLQVFWPHSHTHMYTQTLPHAHGPSFQAQTRRLSRWNPATCSRCLQTMKHSNHYENVAKWD